MFHCFGGKLHFKKNMLDFQRKIGVFVEENQRKIGVFGKKVNFQLETCISQVFKGHSAFL